LGKPILEGGGLTGGKNGHGAGKTNPPSAWGAVAGAGGESGQRKGSWVLGENGKGANKTGA